MYDAQGLGFLVGETDAASATDRKRITNDAYVELAGIRGYWRKRSTTISLTAGTSAYNAPSDFADIYRLYYRRNGLYYEVEVLGDKDWLEVSAISSTDLGDPEYARITQTSAAQNQIEISPSPSSNFISAVTASLTLEYFIEITRLVSDSDQPILPANLRHLIVPLAGYFYAVAQGDKLLADSLRIRAIEAKQMVLKHDLTRTGKARRLRPPAGYYPGQTGRVGYDYR